MGIHCFYAAMQQLLKYWGITVTEADLFFLSGGLNASFSKSHSDHQIRYCDFMPYDRLLVQLEKQFNLQTDIHWMTKQEEHALFHCSLQNMSAPILLCVDQSQLSYHSVRAETKIFHFVLLYQSSKDAENVILYDPFVLCSDGKAITHHKSISKKEFPFEIYCYIHLWSAQPTRKTIDTDLIMIKESIAVFIQDKQTTDTFYGNHALYQFFSQFSQMDQAAIHRNTPVDIAAMFKTYYIPVFDYLLQVLSPIGSDTKLLHDIASLKSTWEAMFITLLMLNYSKDIAALIKRISSEGKRLVKRQKDIFQNVLKLERQK